MSEWTHIWGIIYSDDPEETSKLFYENMYYNDDTEADHFDVFVEDGLVHFGIDIRHIWGIGFALETISRVVVACRWTVKEIKAEGYWETDFPQSDEHFSIVLNFKEKI